MSSDRVEIWRRVDGADTFTREGDWLQVDLKGGDRLRIFQPLRGEGGVVRHEGPVMFENFRYDDGLPAPGTTVTEDCRIKEKNATQWKTSGFVGAKNVVAAQVKVNGTWSPPESNPPPQKFIQYVSYTAGYTPTLSWKSTNA